MRQNVRILRHRIIVFLDTTFNIHGVADGAYHTCDRWERGRRTMLERIGQEMSPDGIIEATFPKDDTWNCVERYGEEILLVKRASLEVRAEASSEP